MHRAAGARYDDARRRRWPAPTSDTVVDSAAAPSTTTTGRRPRRRTTGHATTAIPSVTSIADTTPATTAPPTTASTEPGTTATEPPTAGPYEPGADWEVDSPARTASTPTGLRARPATTPSPKARTHRASWSCTTGRSSPSGTTPARRGKDSWAASWSMAQELHQRAHRDRHRRGADPVGRRADDDVLPELAGHAARGHHARATSCRCRRVSTGSRTTTRTRLEASDIIQMVAVQAGPARATRRTGRR